MLREVLLPAPRIPQLQMIANPQKDHIVAQMGKLPKPLRDQNPAGTVDIDLFGLSKIKPSKDSCFGIGGRRRVDPRRQLLQPIFGVNPQAFIRPWSHKKNFGITKLVPDSFGQR